MTQVVAPGHLPRSDQSQRLHLIPPSIEDPNTTKDDSNSNTGHASMQEACLLVLVIILTRDSSNIAGREPLLLGLSSRTSVEEVIYSSVPALVDETLKVVDHPWHLLAVVTRLMVFRNQVSSRSVSAEVRARFEASMAYLFSHVLSTMREDLTRQHRRWILCFLAVWQGFSTYATAILEYPEEELGEFFLDKEGL